jgi:hypothetical protein
MPRAFPVYNAIPTSETVQFQMSSGAGKEFVVWQDIILMSSSSSAICAADSCPSKVKACQHHHSRDTEMEQDAKSFKLLIRMRIKILPGQLQHWVS